MFVPEDFQRFQTLGELAGQWLARRRQPRSPRPATPAAADRNPSGVQRFHPAATRPVLAAWQPAVPPSARPPVVMSGTTTHAQDQGSHEGLVLAARPR